MLMVYMPVTLNIRFKVWALVDADTLFSLWVVSAFVEVRFNSGPTHGFHILLIH